MIREILGSEKCMVVVVVVYDDCNFSSRRQRIGKKRNTLLLCADFRSVDLT